MGKEAVQEAKSIGKLAKTVQAPYRAERACFLAARKGLEKAVASLDVWNAPQRNSRPS